MAENFGTAACRHWTDAEFLLGDARISNADQLFGLSTECALKSVLVKVAQCIDDGALQGRYRHHVDALWEVIPLHNIGRVAPALVAYLRGAREPFVDWNVAQRYDDVTPERETLERHRAAARRVIGGAGLLGERRMP